MTMFEDGTTHRRAATRLRSRGEIIAMMRRVGLGDRVADAQQLLPDVIDLDRDDQLLSRLGLSLDRIVDGLGGSAW